MPCKDWTNDGRSNTDIQVRYTTPPEVKEKLDSLSRMLCFVMTILEKEGRPIKDYKSKVSSELKQWWTKHKEDDDFNKYKKEVVMGPKSKIVTKIKSRSLGPK